MSNKLLKNYINKVKTHVFGLEASLSQLFNFYVYLLTGEDWVKSCEECPQKQIKLVVVNGKEFILELTQDGLFYRLEEGGTIYPMGSSFPQLEEIKETLIGE